MNKLTLLTFITSSIFLFGCKNESEHLKNKIQKKNEIVNIISYFENSIPVDGNLDSSENEDFEEVVELKIVKNNTIFWCYDTMNLLKIEILGYVSDAQIVYQSSNDTKTIILDKSTIDGAYSIVPSESNNGMNGGKIIIKSGNEILKEIIINYDGCL